jgi:predicted GNAT family acetyltransferase
MSIGRQVASRSAPSGLGAITLTTSRMPPRPTVSHNAAEHRFEVATDHGVATLRYFARGDVLDLAHTAVPQAAEGQGLGGALAQAALEYARDNGLKVIPSCPFVHSYLQKHREYADLVAPS